VRSALDLSGDVAETVSGRDSRVLAASRAAQTTCHLAQAATVWKKKEILPPLRKLQAAQKAGWPGVWLERVTARGKNLAQIIGCSATLFNGLPCAAFPVCGCSGVREGDGVLNSVSPSCIVLFAGTRTIFSKREHKMDGVHGRSGW
jgi:hypothetical protein